MALNNLIKHKLFPSYVCDSAMISFILFLGSLSVLPFSFYEFDKLIRDISLEYSKHARTYRIRI